MTTVDWLDSPNKEHKDPTECCSAFGQVPPESEIVGTSNCNAIFSLRCVGSFCGTLGSTCSWKQPWRRVLPISFDCLNQPTSNWEKIVNLTNAFTSLGEEFLGNLSDLLPLQPTPLYESLWVLSLPVWHNSGQPGTQLWLQRSLVGTNSAPGKERKKRTQFHLLYPEMMLWYCINIFCKFVQCITTQYTYLFFLACNGVKCILRSKQQSTLPPLLLLFLIVPSLPLQLLLTVRIKLSDVVLDTNTSHMIKKKEASDAKQSTSSRHTHTTRTSSNFLASCRRFRQYLIQHLAISALCCLSFSLRSLSVSPGSGNGTQGCETTEKIERMRAFGQILTLLSCFFRGNISC